MLIPCSWIIAAIPLIVVGILAVIFTAISSRFKKYKQKNRQIHSVTANARRDMVRRSRRYVDDVRKLMTHSRR